MKKTFWGFAAIPALALLATSCANETVETKNSDNFLTYGVATGKQTITRAAEMDLPTLKADGFTAKAYYNTGDDAGDLFRDFEVSWNTGNSKWTYTDHPVYHPTDGLTHYAVVPAVAEADFLADGDDAVIEVTATGEVDVIAAAAKTTQGLATANMLFKHLLSQVNFKVTTLSNLDIAIAIDANTIELDDLANVNTYTLNSGNSGTWGTTPTGEVDYSYTLEAEKTEVPVVGGEDGETELVATGGYVGVVDGGLMLMPQTFVAGTGGSFTFMYTLTDTNTGAVVGEGAPTIYFGGFDNKEWVAGNNYTYTINFKAPNVIEYTVEEIPGFIPVDGGSYLVQ